MKSLAFALLSISRFVPYVHVCLCWSHYARYAAHNYAVKNIIFQINIGSALGGNFINSFIFSMGGARPPILTQNWENVIER